VHRQMGSQGERPGGPTMRRRPAGSYKAPESAPGETCARAAKDADRQRAPRLPPPQPPPARAADGAAVQ
jgi:hypothetical protein